MSIIHFIAKGTLIIGNLAESWNFFQAMFFKNKILSETLIQKQSTSNRKLDNKTKFVLNTYKCMY